MMSEEIWIKEVIMRISPVGQYYRRNTVEGIEKVKERGEWKQKAISKETQIGKFRKDAIDYNLRRAEFREKAILGEKRDGIIQKEEKRKVFIRAENHLDAEHEVKKLVANREFRAEEERLHLKEPKPKISIKA